MNRFKIDHRHHKMGHNSHDPKMEHMNHSNMGHMNSMGDTGYMNHTNMLHMNQSNMGSMGQSNHSSMEHMNSSNMGCTGHMNHSDMEHMGPLNHDNMGHMGNMDHDTGYKPYFTTKTSAAMFFQQWPTDTQVGIVTALIASVIIAIALECLHECSRIVFQRINTRRTGSGRFGNDLYGCHEKLFMSVLMMLRVIAGYLLMLSVMTMNAWILISVCLGATIGYGLGKPIIVLVLSKKKPSLAEQKELESILLKDTKSEKLSPSPKARYKSISKVISEIGYNEEGIPVVNAK